MIRRCFPRRLFSPLPLSLASGLIFSAILGDFGSLSSFSDGMSASALFFLVIALSIVAGRLGFFDFTCFSFKKFIEIIRSKRRSEKSSRAITFEDYKAKHRHGKDPVPYFAASAVNLLSAVFLLII